MEEAWINLNQAKTGYEISFNKHFYQHKPLRPLEEVTADMLKLKPKTEKLLKKLVSFGANQWKTQLKFINLLMEQCNWMSI